MRTPRWGAIALLTIGSLLVPTAAFAHHKGGPPPGGPGGPQGSPSQGPPPPSSETPPDREYVTIGGQVADFDYGKHGERKGLFLTDGTEVKFGHDAGEAVAAVVQPGDTVTVDGERKVTRHGDVHVKAFVVTNDATGGHWTNLVALVGDVTDWDYGKHGEIKGFFLPDGTEVKFPHHLADEVAAVVQPGDEARVDGEQKVGRHGERHVHALTITNTATGATVEL